MLLVRYGVGLAHQMVSWMFQFSAVAVVSNPSAYHVVLPELLAVVLQRHRAPGAPAGPGGPAGPRGPLLAMQKRGARDSGAALSLRSVRA